MGAVSSMPPADDGPPVTNALAPGDWIESAERLRLVVVAGPDEGRAIELRAGTYFVGTAPTCELVLADSSVSRRHLEIAVTATGIHVRDLGSTNGSYFQGARFDSITVGSGAPVFIGQSELRFLGEARAAAERTAKFAAFIGGSAVVRELTAKLEKMAASDAPVLVEGETGTGKEVIAEAIHDGSARAGKRLVVCDLAAVSRSLIESELFGHVKGAFTGAHHDRDGAFVEADGGTLLLDEIGELDLEVQPRLLRALERGQVKAVGATGYRDVRVRIVAATNRDLSAEVAAGRFRRDLYHRVAVFRITVPPLRQRREDIPLLARHFLAHVAGASNRPSPVIPPAAHAALACYDWPGNVRELKNVMERAFALDPNARVLEPGLLGLGADAGAGLPIGPDGQPGQGADVRFHEAKERLVQAWERDYVAALLEQCGGNVSLAARSSGIDRGHLHRLIKKHALG